MIRMNEYEAYSIIVCFIISLVCLITLAYENKQLKANIKYLQQERVEIR